MYVNSMKNPSKAKGLWSEVIKDIVHRMMMAAMGPFTGVLGRFIFFAEKFSMMRNMAARRIPAWMMVAAHGCTDPLARGLKIIKVHIM